MKPDSQSYTSSIGDNKTVTLDFSTQIGGPRQTDVGLFMQGVTPTILTDNTGPTFILSEVTTAGGGGIAASVSGDMIFAFSEAVTDAAGEDLRSDDFVIRTGTAGTAAGADTLLTAETDYTIVDNWNDTKFLIRPSVTVKSKLGQDAVTVSGMMVGTPKDILGNPMAASGQEVAGSVSSYLDTISQ
jgi:hypothetical protein